MAAIIILSNKDTSLAGCTCGLTRVEMTQPESGPNSMYVVDAIGRMREGINILLNFNSLSHVYFCPSSGIHSGRIDFA
jgi:hypothetical protein